MEYKLTFVDAMYKLLEGKCVASEETPEIIYEMSETMGRLECYDELGCEDERSLAELNSQQINGYWKVVPVIIHDVKWAGKQLEAGKRVTTYVDYIRQYVYHRGLDAFGLGVTLNDYNEIANINQLEKNSESWSICEREV